jgi:hypothetical protein
MCMFEMLQIFHVSTYHGSNIVTILQVYKQNVVREGLCCKGLKIYD